MLSMLSSHLIGRPLEKPGKPSTSYVIGTCFSVAANPLLSSFGYWIIDFVASKHICSNTRAFKSLKPIQHATVTLPNRTCTFVSLTGDVHIRPHLILTDVLYVPQFKFNLISVSALTKTSTLIVKFFPGHCFIQDNKSLKVIGKGSQIADLYVFILVILVLLLSIVFHYTLGTIILAIYPIRVSIL